MLTWRLGHRSLLCGVWLMCAMGSVAGEMEDRFYQRLKQAENGNVQAMYEVGQMYELGLGTANSRSDALKWYRASADKGHGEAAHQVGYAYYWGKGVAKDRAQAHAWFERAANAGSQAAMPYLSKMYALGQGVPQDKAKAADWANRAATASNLHKPPPPPERSRVAASPAPKVAPPQPQAPPNTEADTTARPAEKQAAAPKPERKRVAKKAARPKPPVSEQSRKQLLGAQWLKSSRPALYLPSSETQCQQTEQQIECVSALRQASLMGRPYRYRYLATLSAFDDAGGFLLTYQREISELMEPPPGGYAEDVANIPDEAALKARVERKPEPLRCRIEKAKQVTCIDSKDKPHVFVPAES